LRKQSARSRRAGSLRVRRSMATTCYPLLGTRWNVLRD